MKTASRLALLTMVLGLALAAPALADRVVVSENQPEAAAASVVAYWTAQRMASAIPMDMAIQGSPPSTPSAAAAQATGPMGNTSSSKRGGVSILLSPGGLTEATSAIVPAYASYPFPHTTYRITQAVYLAFPYRTIGKVFFTGANGGNYVCSGSSIGGRAVLTAGHCVSDGNRGWHRNWSFVPAYRGFSTNRTPYGTWPSWNLATFWSWHASGQFCRDVGVALTTNQNGLRLSQRVGFLGRSWNYTRSKQHWDAFGYPQASPFDGRYMIQTSAEWARDVNIGCSPYPMGIGSGQRPGSSGGPWIRNFYPSASGAVNFAGSIFSFYFTNQVNGLYGPYFDTTVNNFLTERIGRL